VPCRRSYLFHKIKSRRLGVNWTTLPPVRWRLPRFAQAALRSRGQNGGTQCPVLEHKGRRAYGYCAPETSRHAGGTDLGRVSVEEDGSAGEVNAGEEDLCELVVTRGDSPEVLELIEETLNEIAFAVEGEVARARGFSVGF
jgi:hypothetical protein